MATTTKMLGLRRNADIRTLCFVGTYFGLVAFAWRLGWVAWWVNLPLMWVIWFFSFAGAVAVHNAIHCPTFYAKSANKVFQIVLSMVYGHPGLPSLVRSNDRVWNCLADVTHARARAHACVCLPRVPGSHVCHNF